MSFTYFVYISAVGNLLGAFASLVAGLADRWGRANLVAYGLGLTAAIMLFGLPHAGTKLEYGILFGALSFVEGIILVATPALVRDFSPQIGRAGAMGFWTLGPVIGSLVVSAVSSNTLDSHPDWQFQFYVCGIVGFVAFAVALVGLRELAPPLRDQIMMTMRDRALIEAKAKGLDIERALEHPWRQMLRLDIIGSAFAISVFLLIYYLAVGFSVVYFTTVFNFTQKDANGIGNWLWGFDALALVVIGVISDKLRVRKPFMLIGAIGAVVMTIIFLNLASHPDTGYYHLALVMSLLAVFLGVAYAPWMASFTETVEKHNPALTATGLAVWGWILRIVVAAAAFFTPVIVNSVTPLVNFGTEAQAINAQYPHEIATAQILDPVTSAALTKNPNDAQAGLKAVGEVTKATGVAPQEAINRLLALKKVPPADLAFLQAHGKKVLAAQKKSPNQWKHYYWICVGGQLVFIPLIFLMAGEWNPRTARKREEEHEAAVQAELAKLTAVPAGGGGAPATSAFTTAPAEPSAVTVIPPQATSAEATPTEAEVEAAPQPETAAEDVPAEEATPAARLNGAATATAKDEHESPAAGS